MNGLSRNKYLNLPLPTEDDPRSDQQRILDSLAAAGVEERVHIPVHILRKLYPLLDNAKWKITVSLAWNGENWEMVEIEEGDTTAQHYGLAVDLGSTTVVARLLDCNSGEILKEVSCFNKQIQWGTDILSRIFYCKDIREKLEEVRRSTVESICECLDKLDASLEMQGTPSEHKTENNGVSESCDDRGAKNAAQKARSISRSALSMVIAGNTTMIHFLLGMDAFCVFYTPHAVHADCPGFQLARDLDIPLKGYVYCYPAKSNYLGGDIISGMIDTELYKKNEISVFFDNGTNGELVIGNKEFLLCGAGAAGPALEGGVVRTGMRADIGAVDEVKIRDGNIFVHVIGNSAPQGICGSGIIDLLAELFLNGWINLFGTLQPERSEKIKEDPETGEWCVEYSEGLCFYQSDIAEFLRTKSAAYTMVEYMMRESGISMEEIDRFYAAGAFGKHVSKESAITIGMYPDMDRSRLICAGNTSLAGAEKILLDRTCIDDIDRILDEMVYIQFGQVAAFISMMKAAQAIPHTDLELFPSVQKKLEEKQKEK